jgi:hypothetical protein
MWRPPFPGHLVLAALAALGTMTASAQALVMASGADHRVSQSAPASADVRAIGGRAVANQHRDDDALERYERIERQMQVTGGAQPRITDEKTYRIVPTGTGTLRLQLRANSVTVSVPTYRGELETWEKTLEMALDPHNPEIQDALARAVARRTERNEIVDATLQGYISKWIGREMQDGYLCDKLQLDPDPHFRPHDASTEILGHARVTLWIDQRSGQVVRGDAEIIHDISFGGGFLGKVYRGGYFVLKQHPVTPDIWLASYYQYDFSGRKLMFGFEDHKKVEISRYRDLGTVSQALAVARSDIANVATFAGSP